MDHSCTNGRDEPSCCVVATGDPVALAILFFHDNPLLRLISLGIAVREKAVFFRA